MSTFVWVVLICLAALLGLGVGAGVGYVLIRRHDRLNLTHAEHRAAEIVAQAEKQVWSGSFTFGFGEHVRGEF